MPEYINHNKTPVTLLGPVGQKIVVRPNQTIQLSSYYNRYIGDMIQPSVPGRNRPPQLTAHKLNKPLSAIKSARPRAQGRKKVTVQPRPATLPPNRLPAVPDPKQVVGARLQVDETAEFLDTIQHTRYPISNGIGVGILSYNRLGSLQRLIASIRANTDLNRTTVFISDDGSADVALQKYLNTLRYTNEFVILPEQPQLGIAGNSNRLLKCLSRFKYGILLNDDVEIVKPEWEYLYPEAMECTGLHHFCYYQRGVYNNTTPTDARINGKTLRVIYERPQGAVLAFTNELFQAIGYFDQSLGQYGMEHVDWSTRASKTNLQPSGYYDLASSDQFFKLHHTESAVEERTAKYREAKKVYAQREPVVLIDEPANLNLPSLSVIIPYRTSPERTDAIAMVFDNIRASRYPVIELIAAEHDAKPRIAPDMLAPYRHIFVPSRMRQSFNKSKAFNNGAVASAHSKLLLHDADILISNHYVAEVAKILDESEACHLGSRVLYADQNSTKCILIKQGFDSTIISDRLVGYFEGGSVGIRKDTYWRIGGFCEEFWGYGCEDTEFFERLKALSEFHNIRTEDFLHLWHGRSDDWSQCHKLNRNLSEAISMQALAVRVATLAKQNQRYLEPSPDASPANT